MLYCKALGRADHSGSALFYILLISGVSKSRSVRFAGTFRIYDREEERMDFGAFIASLKRGKEDRPIVFGREPLIYDIDDIDGLYYMLDRRLGGCLVLLWSKPMDEKRAGTVTVDGVPLPGCLTMQTTVMGGIYILALPLRGVVCEYGRSYAVHIEGFYDQDGNEMIPADLTVEGSKENAPDPKYADHEKVALQAAEEGIVLLRNDNVLPLSKGSTLNLFGKGVHEFRTGAVGAGKIHPRRTVSFISAARKNPDVRLNEELISFYRCNEDRIPDREILERACKASDTAFVLLTRAAGENQDASTRKGEYYLTDEEDALLRIVSETFEKTCVILNVGCPIELNFLKKYRIDALLYAGFPGMEAGTALVNILTGKVNPSGKLPDTLAFDYYDIPSSKNFYDSVDKPRLTADTPEYVDTVYEEDLYVGYRYFTTFGKKAAFPFGFGLSYTTFSIRTEDIRFDGTVLTGRAVIRNTGDREGKETLEVYVGKPQSDLEKPERELVFFEKTELLAPKEEETISFAVPVDRLCAYSEKLAAWVLDAGTYHVFVGSDALAGEQAGFTVPERKIIKKVENRCVPETDFTRLSQKDPAGTAPKGTLSGIVQGKNSFLPYQKQQTYEAHFETPAPENPVTFEEVKNNPDLAASFVAQLSDPELARLSVCASAGWGMEGIGEAGSLYPLEGRNLPKFPVSDGNSGVNINVRNIGMPSGFTLCASFNKDLIEAVGRVIGEEAKENGISMILGPAMNLHRNPLNGRQPEYFSEDPYLAGTMAGYYSKGVEEAGTASCIKHMICNNCESSRKRNQSVVSERAIRELYFRVFQYALEVHEPAAAMTAYNAVNGVPMAANADLILGLMRDENNFHGFFMTDWQSYDTVDISSMIQAGISWVTPGSLDDTYSALIRKGIADGTIDIKRLRENAAYLIYTIARFS